MGFKIYYRGYVSTKKFRYSYNFKKTFLKNIFQNRRDKCDKCSKYMILLVFFGHVFVTLSHLSDRMELQKKFLKN